MPLQSISQQATISKKSLKQNQPKKEENLLIRLVCQKSKQHKRNPISQIQNLKKKKSFAIGFENEKIKTEMIPKLLRQPASGREGTGET